MSLVSRPRMGLTGNQLKILALLLMTADHIGMLLMPQYTVLRAVGRSAFPIFAYMVAEGCVHSRHRLRYWLTMAGAALVCQIVYFMAMDSLEQCIFVTFSLSILLCTAVDRLVKQLSVWNAFLCALSFAAVWAFCEYLPTVITGFSVDYGFVGTLLPVLVFIAPSKVQKLVLLGVGLVFLARMTPQWPIQWYALFALLPLALYNGERGMLRLKYLFYIYYPLHLAALYGIGLIL